jgi:hypothetical protein
VLLHGCGGLKHESMWSRWVKPWAALFGQHGLGTAVVDSFSPRGVDQVCPGAPGAWAVRLRRQVIEFLTAHGLIADRARR